MEAYQNTENQPMNLLLEQRTARFEQHSNRKTAISIGVMNLNETNKISCPCCGKSMVEEYDICEVCNWENDPVQLWNPDRPGGANIMSLNEAREAYSQGKEVK